LRCDAATRADFKSTTFLRWGSDGSPIRSGGCRFLKKAAAWTELNFRLSHQ
jgi:hypothetical protein